MTTDSTRTSREPSQPRLWEMIVLIAAIAVGLWIFLPHIKEVAGGDANLGQYISLAAMGLAGITLAGPLLMLLRRRRERRRFGPGQLLWFSTGLSAWLMAPPLVYARLRGEDPSREFALCMYIYGTPLMAVYIVFALLAGGWIRPRRRDGKRRWLPVRTWTERVGLLIGLLWALTGGLLLYLIYSRETIR